MYGRSKVTSVKTKEKIINSAITLFNLNGVNDVSIRDICSAMGISPGNFAYHFKNKEAVLTYFYGNMYNDISIDTEFRGNDGFEKLQSILEEITSFMSRYSFFYTDIIDIFRLCPDIKKDYSSNYEDRKTIYKRIFIHFVETGLFVKTMNEGHFDTLAHNIWFTLTFWQSQKKILPTGSKEVETAYILQQIWNSLAPYMTDLASMK